MANDDKLEKETRHGTKVHTSPFLKIILILLVAVIALGFLGYVPFVSDLMGTSRPKDLGIRYTKEDLASAQLKSGIEKKDLPPGTMVEESLRYSGQKQVNSQFTSEELTAWANSDHWKYFALEDVQIKLNDDGTVESSGKINTALLDDYKKSVHLKDEDALMALDKIKYIKNPTYYAKGKFSIVNNAIRLDYDEVNVGPVSLPKELDSKAESLSTRLLNNEVKKFPGLEVIDVKSMEIKDGKMLFDGTLPAVEYGLKS